MLRPYCTITLRQSESVMLPQSVPGILGQIGVGVDLRLRNREEHIVIRAGHLASDDTRRGIRPVGILAKSDQVLPALALPEQLEQALVEDDGARDGSGERRGHGVSIAIPELVEQRECRRAA